MLICLLVVLTHTTHAQTSELDRDEIEKVVNKFCTMVSFTNGEWKHAENLSELFRYYGYTTDLEQRLEFHNTGRNVSTKGRGPGTTGKVFPLMRHSRSHSHE